MENYTPAPWTCHEKNTFFAIVHNGPLVYLEKQSSGHSLMDDTETRANAILIAAAPELCEALTELLKEVHQHCESTCPKLINAIQAAQLAVNKAKGRESK